MGLNRTAPRNNPGRRRSKLAAILGASNVASLTQGSSYLFPVGALQLSNILSVGTRQYVEYSTQDQTGQFFEHVTAINLAKNKAPWTTTSPVAPGGAVPFTGQNAIAGVEFGDDGTYSDHSGYIFYP